MSGELDQRIRLAAFQWLRAQMDVHGDVLPLSITTIPGQYPDEMGGGTLAYAYRGTDPAHPTIAVCVGRCGSSCCGRIRASSGCPPPRA